ncbi:hypothetical protein B6N60_03040 [Richelia sinica FACHB-800]|uniref:Uncharacterized protein n=1 Tax=Richelia sinica FACHB-800 TaxID=1357546 RepID=A0A975T9E1_9NOST|nr:hypothetical protein B6N60_03040 [Richelia sinica FACHB-800]
MYSCFWGIDGKVNRLGSGGDQSPEVRGKAQCKSATVPQL